MVVYSPIGVWFPTVFLSETYLTPKKCDYTYIIAFLKFHTTAFKKNSAISRTA